MDSKSQQFLDDNRPVFHKWQRDRLKELVSFRAELADILTSDELSTSFVQSGQQQLQLLDAKIAAKRKAIMAQSVLEVA